jgi:hypothetical protein
MEQLHDVTAAGPNGTSIFTLPQWHDPSIPMTGIIAADGPHRQRSPSAVGQLS